MVQESVWFAVGAVSFLTAVVGFLWFAVTRGDIRSQLYYLPPIHATIAGVAYVGMALVAAGRLGDPVSVVALRFGDWLFSTPIITYYLGRVAGIDTRSRRIAVATNVGMIAVGFVFVETAGAISWAAFALSTLLFLALVWQFFGTFQSALTDAAATTRSLFTSLRDLTVATWSLYPIVYFAGPLGIGLLQPSDLSFTIVVLDVIAKVGFMAIMLVRHYQLETFVDPDVASVAD